MSSKNRSRNTTLLMDNNSLINKLKNSSGVQCLGLRCIVSYLLYKSLVLLFLATVLLFFSVFLHCQVSSIFFFGELELCLVICLVLVAVGK